MRGFTLIELLVVLALMGLALTVASPLIANALPGTEMRAAARDLTTGLRYARSLAIASNSDVTFDVDVAARRFSVSQSRRSGGFPDDADITLTTANSELFGSDAGGIRFFPDGTSTGGGIEISRNGRRFLVTVDWLTGRVEVAP
jgi:general secretion pathway protein H